MRLTGEPPHDRVDEVGDRDEVAEFRAGEAEGTDPQPVGDGDGDPGPAREAVTRLSSWWANNDPCTTCGQTFRVGDRVVVGEPGAGEPRVRHLDPELGCAVARSTATVGVERREFSAGLREAWPAARGVDLVELTADDWQVARPGRHNQTCTQCGDTFRAGEVVVLCPCHPGGDRADPRRCGQAVHRDPAAGLPCWEEWCPTGVVTICPTTHTPRRQLSVVPEVGWPS